MALGAPGEEGAASTSRKTAGLLLVASEVIEPRWRRGRWGAEGLAADEGLDLRISAAIIIVSNDLVPTIHQASTI